MRQTVLCALTLGLFVSCAPSVSRAPETQLHASAELQGHLLTVSLLNMGPNALLLENSCPRPFGIDFLDYPGKEQGALKPQQYDTCWNVNFPPQVWRVGESLSTGVTVDYPAGKHTLRGCLRPISSEYPCCPLHQAHNRWS
ncbi:hypothetical protein, partial [Deinococcus sp.]|uniref:hypothetical protein n=1 Tax=Deinococcus sp. TaxID=47478 RepID=UPI0025C1908B